MTATVRMYAAGMLMVMTLRQSRYRPPTISASAEVSPMTPPVWPSRDSTIETSGRVPVLRLASGVAVEIASVTVTLPKSGSFACGAVQVVMKPAQEAIMNARAPSAGFMKFLPMPPNSILTITMPNRPPNTVSHSGAATGMLKAIRTPVTKQERSPTVFSCFTILL